MLTENELIQVMIYYMQAFNDEGVTITENTVHEECLSPNDGFGPANSQQMYKDAVRWTLFKKKNAIKTWPLDWSTRTLAQLAHVII